MSEWMRCPCFNVWIKCDPRLCRTCGDTEKALKIRASKCFTNPNDARVAFKELIRRRGLK